jgi:hypothetical protein
MRKKKHKSNGKRHAMWLTVYLRMAGVTPLPYKHQTEHLYVADLQRQLSYVRRNLGENEWHRLQHSARQLVRTSSLETVAAGGRLSGGDSKDGPQGANQSKPTPSSSTAQCPVPTASEKWNCRRKLRHPDYLSALRHAGNLGEPDLRIYPCSVCLGLHIGHDPDATRLKGVERNLDDIEFRLAVLEVERKQLNRHRDLLLERQEQLRERKRAKETEIDAEIHHLSGE